MGEVAKVTAAALLVIASMTAQAAEPETLTLACKGTVTEIVMDRSAASDAKTEPISMGIIVNLTTEGAVEGFTYPAHINRFKATIIEFLGVGNTEAGRWTVGGSIDRVTGDVSATETSDRGWQGPLLKKVYSLKCRPTQRMF